MKTTRIVVMAVSMILLAAGLAVADISIENGNTNNNTNTTTVTNSANSAATGGAASVTNEAALPTVGFNPLQIPGIAVKGGEWRSVCPGAYNPWAVADFQEAVPRFGFIDFFTLNWGKDYEFTSTGKALSANNEPVYCLNYWPKDPGHGGDRWNGSLKIKGKVGMTDDAYIARAYSVCKSEKGSRLVAVRIKDKVKTDTKTASFNLSGLIAGANSGGGSGTAVATGLGVGKATVESEDYIEAEALCMTQAVAVQAKEESTPAPSAHVSPPVEKSEPAPAVCNEDVYRKRIEALREGTKNCPKDCLNNELLWKQIGDASVQWYNCTGRTNKSLLHDAIYAYKRAGINFSQGVEPSGKKTRNLKGAQEIIKAAQYNTAWCILETEGYDSEMKYARSKGLKSAPEKFEELKF